MLLNYFLVVGVLSLLHNFYFYRKSLKAYKFNRSFKVKAISFTTLTLITALIWPISLLTKLIGRHGNDETLLLVVFADLSFVMAFHGEAYLIGDTEGLQKFTDALASYGDEDLLVVSQRLQVLVDRLNA